MLNGWKTNFCFCICLSFTVATLTAVTNGQTQSPGFQNQQNAVPSANQSAAQNQAQQQYQQQNGQQQNGQQQNGQQRPSQQQSVTPQQQAEMLRAAENASMVAPQRPFAELSQEDNNYLIQFLDYWQQSSEQVKQYVCDFQRYAYDSEIVSYRDAQTQQLAASSVAVGQIRYATPDKGFYETTQIWDFKAPPKTPGEEAEFEKRTDKNKNEIGREKWICDGRNVYEFDFANKRLYESKIPKEMQGESIINSPIPFLFGAKKDKILERYWVRVVPQNSETEFWLEAYPKRIEDARLYSKIEVIIAKEDFLPKAMHVYSPQYDPAKNNFQSQYFSFQNRKVNNELDQLKNFLGIFVRPQTPVLQGWKRVDRDIPQAEQAQLPGNPKK